VEGGVAQVAALEGGWAAWLRAGYPVEGKQVQPATATASALSGGGRMAELGSAEAPVTILEFSDFQ
jgi:3-mercaptopyruvate sulfurtransferase SseA